MVTDIKQLGNSITNPKIARNTQSMRNVTEKWLTRRTLAAIETRDTIEEESSCLTWASSGL